MNLNKKVPLIIFPVILSSFLIVATSLYVIEGHAIYSLGQSAVELDATELSGSFTQYSLLAKGFLASLLQSDALRRFLDSEDDQLKSMALGSGLDSILNSLAGISADYFSITFIKSNGELEYYYENSLDPFAEPDPALLQWGTRLFAHREQSATKYFPDHGQLMIGRTLNRQTLKPPLDFTSHNTLAIIVSISPTEFLQRSEKLQAEYRTVSFVDKDATQEKPARLEARKDVTGFGTITVEIDESSLKATRNKVLKRMFLGFAVLVILTQLVLQWLLRRYVINPLNRLEKQFAGIDLNADQEVEIYKSRDEIGNLSASFANLYEKLKTTYSETKELAEKDTLTNLYNRRIFNMTLNRLIERAKRKKSLVALIYLDIDNFKFVNDNYGHTAGDVLLKAFAYRLHQAVRGRDVIFTKNEQFATTARLAGDEFAVIIHGYTDPDAPAKVANRILSICPDGFTCEAGRFPITLSIGVSTFPRDGSSSEELVVNADSAMYQSKKSGKNTVSFYTEELSVVSRRMQNLEVELKQLDVSEFELVYMPIVESRTGRIHSLEALLRWHSQKLGTVPPAEFIPLAEGLGIFQKIDLWVIENAFAESALLRRHLGDRIRISINISAAELSQQAFTDTVLPLLGKYNGEPSSFTFEITETFYQDHMESGLNVLHTLHEAGFHLAIDDLGSGYTSLLQIVEFPIDMVKIDRTFVEKSISGNKINALKSLITFCHAQDLSVTAEGIETKEDMEILRQAGCNYLQGYYFSKPMSAEKLIAKWQARESQASG